MSDPAGCCCWPFTCLSGPPGCGWPFTCPFPLLEDGDEDEGAGAEVELVPFGLESGRTRLGTEPAPVEVCDGAVDEVVAGAETPPAAGRERVAD